jgi:chromosome segregation ATPase
MTDDLEDFSHWRGSIEARLGTLESAAETQKADLKTQADLRAKMDEDLGTLSAKFGAQERLIQAISESQSDHTARLTRLETGQDELRTKLDLVHVGVETIQLLLRGLNPGDGEPDALS